MRSAMKGMKGATTPDSVSNTVFKVAKADCTSSLVPALFQKQPP